MSYRRRSKPISEMNVVPYIDVMLVLLVIFMVTAPMLSQGIKVDLPKTTASKIDSKTPMPIIISIDASGKYYLNDNPKPTHEITAGNLAARVKALLIIAKQDKKSRPVYVKGDQKVSYGKIASAMALLQNAGAKNIGLLTDKNS